MARPTTAAFLAAATLLSAGAARGADIPAPIAAAIADSHRPATDTGRDDARKPAEMMMLAGVKPGEIVLEILPGGGYFTRLLSKAVGPTGHVYAATPDPKSKFAEPAAEAIAADPTYANVSVIQITAAAMGAMPPLDMIWTAQNYHDMHLSQIHVDVPGMDKLWLSILKPGGELMVIDHVASTGAPVTDTADKLHRIDPAAARAEIEAAGFAFVGESDVLRNPADPHTSIVFDPSIRGHTDQFAYLFRKPG